jgi:hypothetical protein
MSRRVLVSVQIHFERHGPETVVGHIQFNNAEAHGAIAHLRNLIGERGPVSWRTWEKHYGQPIRPGRREEIERLALELAGRLDELDLSRPETWPVTLTPEKTRETQVRRLAKRLGIHVEKSRRRSKTALDYGQWTVVEGNGTGAIHKLADLTAVEAYLAECESRMSTAEDQNPRSYTVHIELTMWDNFEGDDADSPAVYTALDVSIDQPNDPRDLLTVAALKAALEQFDGGSADEPIPF